jgi:hypothetical protein
MRILIAGMWRWPQYEQAFARGLRESGAEVIELGLAHHFDGFAGRVEQAFSFVGPAARRAGRAVIEAARRERPDYVLFWRPTHPLRSTLAALRAMGIPSISYNNDDPFSPRLAHESNWRARNVWRLYLKALPHFDFNFFYRRMNVEEALAHGARHADLLLPYFMPWQDRPVQLTADEEARFGSDCTFIGHFEDDGRDGDLLALAEAGHKVRVWGDATWRRSKLDGATLIPHPIEPALGDDYARALCGAKICISYMSKLNRDGYTRRCFEIPAARQVMLAERTTELTALFREDEEACFFSSREELLGKARQLLDEPEFRARVAAGGLRRVWADGHDVASRARQFIGQLDQRVGKGGVSA